MPRFYLDLNECGDVTRDREGVELPDLDAARLSAIGAAREIMCAEIIEGRLCLGCRIEVRDESGAIVADVPFRDIVTVKGI